MSDEWTNTDLVFRQVHPNHREGEMPNSQAFNPTPKDEDMLSVDDAAQVSAQGSWEHFTKTLGFKSAGTWALSFEEITACGDLALTRKPVVDASDASKNNPAHCVVDFTQVPSKGQKRKRAQTLAINASTRGCRFEPPI